MTHEEALSYLNNAAKQYKGTRQDHEILIEAVNLLKTLIDEAKLAQQSSDNEKVTY